MAHTKQLDTFYYQLFRWHPICCKLKTPTCTGTPSSQLPLAQTSAQFPGGLGFWLEFLLLTSQEGKVTSSVTVSGRNSVVHHTVDQISFQLSEIQNGFLGTVLSDAAPTLSDLVPIHPPWSRKLGWITTKGAFQPERCKRNAPHNCVLHTAGYHNQNTYHCAPWKKAKHSIIDQMV